MLVALLARGHLLVEGVPGLAKTMAVKTLAQAIGGEFQRIQFTSDLVPADVVGTRIYNQRDGEFQVSFGPVFANLLLADEINRAPAKVQSALLEVMQERQVTIGRETFPAPDPFLVMATQNPIESEGTYPLPEAQLDRFMFKVLVGYPTRDPGVRRGRADDQHAGAARGGDRHRDAARTSSAPPTPCTSTRRSSSTPCGSPPRPATSPRGPTRARPLRRRSAPARARRSTWCSARRRSRSCAAATTPCPTDAGAGQGRAAAPDRAVLRGARRRRLARRAARPRARRRSRCPQVEPGVPADPQAMIDTAA